MSTDWTTPYRAALQEQDPAKLPDLCERARRAIHDRTLELGTKAAAAPEREQLEEALRQLVMHEAKSKPKPPTR